MASNLEFFLDSFGQNYPEENHGTLDCISIALVCAFNRQGTLLAVGCNDGRICIWDFTSRSIVKIITGHVHPVCSLSWSRNGQRIASASTDSKVCIWQTLTGEPVWQNTFSPIMKVQFHPRSMNEFMVLPFKHLGLIVTHGRSGFRRLPSSGDPDDYHTYVTYNRHGDFIITGDQKGRIAIIDSLSLEIRNMFHVLTSTFTPTAIRSVEVSRRKDFVAINAADRVIRVYKMSDLLPDLSNDSADPEPLQKFQDLVNRNNWKTVFFSGDADYVCAGTVRTHALHIWEIQSGTLVKILHGTKGETLMDAAWHPIKPIIVSVAGGIVSIWSQTHVENWTAFTPDFRELDENVEYEERESEFDLEDEDKSEESDDKVQDESDDVDVVTVEKSDAFCSSDEEEDDPNAVLYIPVMPEVEDPEDAAWLHTFYPETHAAPAPQDVPAEVSNQPKKQKTAKETPKKSKNGDR